MLIVDITLIFYGSYLKAQAVYVIEPPYEYLYLKLGTHARFAQVRPWVRFDA